MPFIKFKELNRSHAAKASISPSGTISFNDGARRRFKMDDQPYCVLYYDPDTKRVGIELTGDEKAEGAKKLRLRTTGADVAAKSFFQWFELEVKQTMGFDLQRDEESGLLFFDLSAGKIRNSGKESSEEQLTGQMD